VSPVRHLVDPFLIANELLEQDNHAVGFAFWTWKENGGAHNWGVFDPPKNGSGPVPSSGCIRPGRERLLERVYPRSSADPGLSFRYDPDSGAFSLRATGPVRRPGHDRICAAVR
jgi:hypothetical protein